MALDFFEVDPSKVEDIKAIPPATRNGAAISARMAEYDGIITKLAGGATLGINVKLDPQSDDSRRKVQNRLNHAATRAKTAIATRVEPAADGADFETLYVWLDDNPNAVIKDPETGEVKEVIPVRERRKKGAKANAEAAPAVEGDEAAA